MAHFDGYELELAPTPAPSTIGVSYSAVSLSCPTTSSQSSTSPIPLQRATSRSLKRKRSDAAMTVTTVTVSLHTTTDMLPMILPDLRHNTDEPYVAPPSPVPTEIIDETAEETAEDRMAAAVATGVKVRDFAYEPVQNKDRDQRAPELWNRPLESLLMLDRYVRINPDRDANFRLSGKTLHNLLSTGWVTREEASRNWREMDWKAVDEYTERPLGPYPVCIPSSIKKPTASYRAALRLDLYLTQDDDVPEECIYVPPDEPGMDDGVKRRPLPPSALKLSRPSARSASRDHHGSVDAAHADKRRRVNSTPSNAAITTPLADSRAPSRTLSRSASFQGRSNSRAATPPFEEASASRAPGRLARTQTLARIPVR